MEHASKNSTRVPGRLPGTLRGLSLARERLSSAGAATAAHSEREATRRRLAQQQDKAGADRREARRHCVGQRKGAGGRSKLSRRTHTHTPTEEQQDAVRVGGGIS